MPRTLAMIGNVEGARPSGAAGPMPADVAITAIKPHGRGVPYVSDVPYDEPYADRANCAGTRKDGHACQGKAAPGLLYCSAHADQG